MCSPVMIRLSAAIVYFAVIVGAQENRVQNASPIQRAIDEFKIRTKDLGLRADSPAKTRSNAGAGPAWHGRIYENLRNDAFDAMRHEIRQRGGAKHVLRRNQFGFNVGGPLVIPRLGSAGNTFLSPTKVSVSESPVLT